MSGSTCGGPAPGVLLITNIPTPYRIPLFNEIHEQLAAKAISFKVIFAALGYERRKWAVDMAQCAFPWEVLPEGRVRTKDHEHALFTYSGLTRVLRLHSNWTVVVGGFSFATIKVWLRSFWSRQPYIIWSGAVDRTGEDSFLKRLQRRLLVQRAAGFLAYGTAAKEYLVKMGAPAEAVAIAINTVDTEFFRNETNRLRAESPRQSEPKRILYVGNLEKGKRIDHLLLAAAALKKKRNDFVVDIVGGGSCEGELKQMVAELNLDNCVKFHGFVQRPEIARHLSQAYCFAFPSEYDVWGLVLVEAMAAGVPCVSSIHSGATRDLIKEDATGFAVDFGDTIASANALDQLLNDPSKAQRLGMAAACFIAQEVTVARSAEGFIRAIGQTPLTASTGNPRLDITQTRDSHVGGGR